MKHFSRGTAWRDHAMQTILELRCSRHCLEAQDKVMVGMARPSIESHRKPLVWGGRADLQIEKDLTPPPPSALNLGPVTLGVQGLGLKSQTLNRKKPSKPSSAYKSAILKPQ